MSNINVKVVGTANVTQMVGQFGKLETQVAAINAQLSQMVKLSHGVDASGFDRMTRAAALNDKVFRSAVGSTGMFEQQQMRLSSASDTYTEKLKKQKLSFKEMISQMQVGKSAYKEQLALQNMIVRQSAQVGQNGRRLVDVTYAREVSSELDTMANRMSFLGAQMKSGSTQMINWGKNTQWAGRQMTVGFTMPIAMASAALGVLAYKVDQQLTRIAKVYDTTADQNSRSLEGQMAYENELAQVRKDASATAVKAAKDYGSAATDTLSVQAELAAAGQKGTELQKATNEVMRIAKLGELDYATATKTAISLQSTYKMSTQELSDAFNFMNAIENATSLSTKDFSDAIPIASTTVKAFGGDIKDTAVLLTAMKEKGIGAVEGANAIKSALTRIANPGKAAAKVWNELTQTNITKLYQDSNGIIDVFKRLGEATKGLDPKDANRAYSKLFGTQQNARLTSLTHAMEDLNDTTTQVGRAFELTGASAAENAKTAELEIKQANESISGQFKKTLETLKTEASVIGRPIVEAATLALKAVEKVSDAFSSLPKAAKLMLAVPVVIAAIAGPVVMLTGLFGTLLGTGLKVFGGLLASLARLRGGMSLTTVSQKAQSLMAQKASTELTREATAAEMLRLELKKLTLAQAQANGAVNKQRASALMAQGMSGSAAYGQLAAEKRTALRNAGLMNEAGQSNSALLATTQSNLAASSNKIKMNWQAIGSSAGIAAMGAGMMLSSSHGTAGEIGKMLLMAGLFGPMLLPVLNGMKAAWVFAAAKSKEVWASTLAATAAQRSAASLTGRVALANVLTGTVVSNMRAGVTAIGAGVKGLSAALGPAGWLIIGSMAVYTIFSKIKAHNEKIAAQQKKIRDDQAGLVTLTQKWAEQQQSVNNKYASYKALVASGASQTDYNNAREFYTKDENKGSVEQFNLKSAKEQEVALRSMYEDLIMMGGASVDSATSNLTAFLRVSGVSISEAEQRALSLKNTLGDLSTIDWNKENKDYFGQIVASFSADGMTKEVTNMMDVVSRRVSTVFASGSKESIAEAGQQLTSVVGSAWDGLAEQIGGDFVKTTDDGLKAAAKTGGSALREYYEKNGKEAFKNIERYADTIDPYSGVAMKGWVLSDFSKEISDAESFDRALGKSVATSAGIKTNVNGIDDVLSSIQYKASLLSFEEAQKEAMRLAGALNGFGKEFATDFGDINDIRDSLAGLAGAGDKGAESARVLSTEIYALGRSQGFKVGADDAETLYNIINGVRDSVAATAQAVNYLGISFGQAVSKFGSEDMKKVLQGAMKSVQSAIVDARQSQFDNQMDAALDAKQAYWDARSNSLSEKITRETNALDKKQDKRKEKAEKYWTKQIDAIDARIKKEKDADDISQKIFEKEKERISRLAEAQNSSIDFNAAVTSGKFDEAAKIRNDSEAKVVQNQIDDASAETSTASEKRIAALEKQKTAVEEAKTSFLKRLSDEADAEKQALALSQKRRQEALKAQTTAALAASKAEWNIRKGSLAQQLALFQQFIPRNEAELKKHMASIGMGYKEFEKNTLNPIGESWSKMFNSAWHEGLKKESQSIATDKMWSSFAQGSVTEMLKGVGLNGGLKAFKKYMKTGVWPDEKDVETRHEGGEIGSGTGSRKGVARSLKGLHSSEVMIRAQKGEFMVNKEAAAAHPDLLNDINSGRINASRSNVGMGRGGGGRISTSTILGSIFNRGILSGLNSKLANISQVATEAKSSAMTSLFPSLVKGSGGLHKASVAGKGWGNSHDYHNGPKSPLYAFNDGVVTESRAITSGGSPGNGRWPTPYRSYGETMVVRGKDGHSVRYAHLYPGQRFFQSGDTVKGGDMIGLSGNTGNAQGAGGGWHTHFEVDGSEMAREWFAKNGIPLKVGGTIKNDNTPALLHKNERVLTAPLTSKLDSSLELLARVAQQAASGVSKTKAMEDFPTNNALWDVLAKPLAQTNTSIPGYTNPGASGADLPRNAWMGQSAAPTSSSTSAVTPGTTGTGGATTIRSGSYNVLYTTKNTSTQKDLTKLMKQADVLSLSEYTATKRKLNPWIQKQGWGITAPKQPGADAAVMWNKKKYTASETGSQLLNKKIGYSPNGFRGKGGSGHRYAAYAHLKDNTTGRSFWQIAAHTIAHIWQSQQNRDVQQEQYASLGKLSERLTSQGDPVFLGGDLNNDPRNTHAGLKSRGERFFSPLGDTLTDNWNSKTMKGHKGTMGNSFLDYMFYNKKYATLLGQQIVGKGLASDHKALLTQFSLPSLSKGTENVKWDNTLANLHAGESVLTKDLTTKFKEGVNNFANGGNSQYTVNVNVSGTSASAEDIATVVERRLQRAEARKPGSRKN